MWSKGMSNFDSGHQGLGVPALARNYLSFQVTLLGKNTETGKNAELWKSKSLKNYSTATRSSLDATEG